MNCREFREAYSDYTDGLLDPQRSAEARAHLRECGGCRRFDAAFRTGVSALRDLPAMDVSRGFASGLRRRLQREFAARLPVVAHWSGTVGTLLLIAMVGFVVWDVRAAPGPGAPIPSWFTRRAAPVASAPVAIPRLAAPDPDTGGASLGASHPLASILLAADTLAGDASPHHTRYELPAAWGGP